MSFSDIFKSSFLDNFTSVSLLDMGLTLGLAFCIGLLIFFTYKKTYAGVMYSASFGAALIAMTMITSLVILAVTSNVVLSLGMVGALSIVRFRSAVKEPLDICYLFWAVAAGIVLAAGLIPLAVIGSVIIAVVLLIFVNRKPGDNPYILVITCADSEAEKAADEFVKAHVAKSIVKSKSARRGLIELNYDIRLKGDDTAFVSELSALNNVNSATLVSYNGDFMA